MNMKNTTNELTLEQAFTNFIKVKEIENLSPETIEYYKNCYMNLKQCYGGDNPCFGINVSCFIIG